MSKLNFGGGAKAAPAKPAAKSAPTKKSAPTRKAPVDDVVEAEVEVVDEKPAKTAKQEINKPAKQELAKATPAYDTGFDGELDQSDLQLPRLNVVSPTSKLHTEDEFDLGSVIFEKELELCTKGENFYFVVLQARKDFQQKIDFDGGEKPLIFHTKDEVEENGGTTVYSQDAIDEERYYAPVANILLAVKAPDDLPAEELHRFPMEFDGSNWAKAVVTVQGGSYTAFAKPIITAAMGKLRSKGGIFKGMWVGGTAKKSNDKNSWFVFTASFAGMIDDEESVEFFADLANESSLKPASTDE